MTALAFDLGSIAAPFGTSGVSEEAKTLEVKRAEVTKDFSRAVTIRRVYGTMVSDLYDAAVASLESGWDGYGAEPVQPMAVSNAIKFLVQLPYEIPLPEVAVDSDGEISFDWATDRHHAFSVSVGCGGELSYGGIFGPLSAHGSELLGDELPELIAYNLRRLFRRY